MSDKMPGWMLRDLAAIMDGRMSGYLPDFLREEAARREADAKPRWVGIDPEITALANASEREGPGSAADKIEAQAREIASLQGAWVRVERTAQENDVLKARVARLESVLRDGVHIERLTRGNASRMHMRMVDWANVARAALAEANDA